MITLSTGSCVRARPLPSACQLSPASSPTHMPRSAPAASPRRAAASRLAAPLVLALAAAALAGCADAPTRPAAAERGALPPGAAPILGVDVSTRVGNAYVVARSFGSPFVASSGEVVGYVTPPQQAPYLARWREGGLLMPLPLPEGCRFASGATRQREVSPSGLVTGQASCGQFGSELRAYYSGSNAQGLQGGGSIGFTVNDAGTVAGLTTVSGDRVRRPAIWNKIGLPFVGSLPPGFSESHVPGPDMFINEGGDVAGTLTAGVNRPTELFLWRAGATQLEVVASIAAGATVVGVTPARTIVFNNGSGQSFRWTRERGVQGLGPNGAPGCPAAAVAEDETVIGHCGGLEPERAMRWTPAGGFRSLGVFAPEPRAAVIPRAISPSGAVIVGTLVRQIPGTGRAMETAFRWTAAGGVEDLGALGGTRSWATSVNDDGEVAGWYNSRSDPNVPFWVRWDGTRNRAPELTLAGVPDSAAAGSSFTVQPTATDPDGDAPLRCSVATSGAGTTAATTDEPCDRPRTVAVSATATGALTLTVTAVDPRGGQTQVTRTVSVVAAVRENAVPVVADLRADPATGAVSIAAKACGGRYTVCLRFAVGDANGAADAPFQVAVDWGDGTPWKPNSVPVATPLVAPHDYAVPGSYRVTVKVTDRRGATGTAGTTLTVAP